MTRSKSSFRELEFRTLVGRIQKFAGKTVSPEIEPQPAPRQQLSLFGEPVTRIGEAAAGRFPAQIVVDTPEALAELQARLATGPLIAFDTETTSTDPMRAELVGISLAVQEGEGYYIPLGHNTGQPQLPAGPGDRGPAACHDRSFKTPRSATI